MSPSHIKCKIIWSITQLPKNRIISFCFNGICMPTRIENSFNNGQDLIIEISFIQPIHFKKYIEKGYHFTIQEGLKIILGVGYILDFDRNFWETI